jgi:D-threo-aldose 1-dehydrogenase
MIENVAAHPVLERRRPLGGTGVEVTSICLGGGPLGSMPENFGHATSADDAIATVLAAFDSPFNFLDTSAGYSGGESERRIGLAIAAAGGLPPGFVLQTKVDPDPLTGEFNGPQVRRSFEASLTRLGLDRVEILHLHDPERIGFAAAMAPGGPVAALIALREEGLAGRLGVAGGPVGLMGQFLDTGVFDVLLTHNRWTLADRTADALLTQAARAGIGVLNAAPFGGGVLARGTAQCDKYCYQPLAAATRSAIRAVERICADADVPLGAAALQFSTREPRIDATVVGVSRPERIAQTAAWATWDIPGGVWEAIVAAAGQSAGLG